jgi:hypothetical protein
MSNIIRGEIIFYDAQTLYRSHTILGIEVSIAHIIIIILNMYMAYINPL